MTALEINPERARELTKILIGVCLTLCVACLIPAYVYDILAFLILSGIFLIAFLVLSLTFILEKKKKIDWNLAAELIRIGRGRRK